MGCDGVRHGYVIGYICSCGGFNHTLLAGFMICMFCGKRREVNILEGDGDDVTSTG